MSGRAARAARGIGLPPFDHTKWRFRKVHGRTYVSRELCLRYWREEGCRPRFRRFVRALHATLNQDSQMGNPWVRTRGKRGFW